jgi:hypothetical protein
MEPRLTLARLRELMEYCPETGEFRWRVRRGGRAPAGSVAGSVEGRGYTQIRIDGRHYMAHRLAWLWTFGRWPPAQIDHRDRDRSNNRISNLRKATNGQNNANGAGWSASGFKGVSKVGGRWMARIRRDKRERYLGLFETPEEAHAAYCRAAADLHKDFACAEHRDSAS